MFGLNIEVSEVNINLAMIYKVLEICEVTENTNSAIEELRKFYESLNGKKLNFSRSDDGDVIELTEQEVTEHNQRTLTIKELIALANLLVQHEQQIINNKFMTELFLELRGKFDLRRLNILKLLKENNLHSDENFKVILKVKPDLDRITLDINQLAKEKMLTKDNFNLVTELNSSSQIAPTLIYLERAGLIIARNLNAVRSIAKSDTVEGNFCFHRLIGTLLEAGVFVDQKYFDQIVTFQNFGAISSIADTLSWHGLLTLDNFKQVMEVKSADMDVIEKKITSIWVSEFTQESFDHVIGSYKQDAQLKQNISSPKLTAALVEPPAAKSNENNVTHLKTVDVLFRSNETVNEKASVVSSASHSSTTDINATLGTNTRNASPKLAQ